MKQLLSYRNSVLSVQNVLVSPIFLRKINETNTPSGFSWKTYYTSCFNPIKNKYSKNEKLKFIDLGIDEEKYDFHYALYDTNTKAKFFTKLNPILSKHIYEDIIAKTGNLLRTCYSCHI